MADRAHAKPRSGIPSGFRLENNDSTGHARFTDGRVSLVRFRYGWRWEYYHVLQTGPSRGLEMFVRYLRTEEAAQLEQALTARLRQERGLASMTMQQALRRCAVDVVTGQVVE